MDIPVNYLAVLVAAVANMVVGSFWFGPLFGKQWVKLSGIKMGGEKSSMTGSYVTAFISSLVIAYVLSHFIWLTAIGMGGEVTLNSAMTTAFWAWLGFVATVGTGVVSWEGKPWGYWGITVGYWLVALVVMGAIIGSWR